MIRLAICDNEQAFLDKVEAIVISFNRTHKGEVNYQVEKYTSPCLLRDDIIEGKPFDVFLLAIEMTGLDGISLAAQIRDNIPFSIIAFLSSRTEFQFTQQGFKLQAFRYISKLAMESALMEMLEAAIQEWQKKRPAYFVYSHYSESFRIPLDEVLYVHRVNRTAIIHTEYHGELPSIAPLKTIYSELNDPRFAYVDQSCIVNMDKIVQLGKNEIILKNAARLPVSRKMMPALKAATLRLWGEEE